MKNFAILASVVLILASVADAAPTKRPTQRFSSVSNESATDVSESAIQGFVLTPYLQYVFLNPSTLNSFLSSAAQKADVNTSYRIGGTPGFGASADYYVLPNLAFGLRLEYFQSSTDAVTVKRGDKRSTVQSTLSAVPAYATATFAAPVAPRFDVGTTFGMGVPLSYSYGTEVSGSSIEGTPNGTNSYSATPMTWMLQGFGRFTVNDNMAIQLNAGYRRLVSSQFKANEAYGKTVKEGDLLQDEDSKTNVKIDASSFVTSFGLAVSF